MVPRRRESSPTTSGIGWFGKQEAPPAIHLLETLSILDHVGPPTPRRGLRVARQEPIGAAGDLERVGLVVLRDAGVDRGVWISLSEAGRRLLTTGLGRLAG